MVPLTLDDYQCSGNLELDFTELCKLMGVKKIPSVKLKQSKSVMGKYVFHNKTIMFRSPAKDVFLRHKLIICSLIKPKPGMKVNQSQTSLESQMTTWSSEPCLEIELENEDHDSVKAVRISGKAVASVGKTPKKYLISKCL